MLTGRDTGLGWKRLPSGIRHDRNSGHILRHWGPTWEGKQMGFLGEPRMTMNVHF